jgi:hypothetical protein
VHVHARVGFVRYTDDSWLFLRNPGEWENARDEYVALLKELGLELNLAKSELYTKMWDDPESVIRHAGIAYATEGGSKRISTDEALEMLGDAARDKDWTAARFCLTTLKQAGDPRGVKVLETASDVFDMIAGNAADYLVVLARNSVARRKVDHDWLLELATREGDSATLFGQLHACRALAELQTSKDTGRQLHELAFQPKEQQARVPLQAWAATAWASSAHWKVSRAIDGVRDKGSLSVRRALVLGCAARTLSKPNAKHVRSLTKLEPDLGPTVEYALAT